MTINDLIPGYVIDAVSRAGLHKVAGAMNGLEEVSLKEAVAMLGARAYMRRKEAASIANGLAAYGELVGEKTGYAADSLLGAIGGRAVVPMLGGAAAAALPAYLLSHEDAYGHKPSVLPWALAGAGAAGVLSAADTLRKIPVQQSMNAAHALHHIP